MSGNSTCCCPVRHFSDPLLDKSYHGVICIQANGGVGFSFEVGGGDSAGFIGVAMVK